MITRVNNDEDEFDDDIQRCWINIVHNFTNWMNSKRGSVNLR